MRQIAVYGKGGIGKSTTSSNLSAALSELGNKVMQIGCDPKQDSTVTLARGFLPSILQTLQENNITFDSLGSIDLRPELISKFVVTGFNGIICTEAGGPKPGVGCAGRGVLVALEYLQNTIFGKYNLDFIVYDVLGDVVCGGFAAPMRKGFANEVYLLTSGELMAMYAANNISVAIKRLTAENAKVRLGGIIHNRRNVVGEIELMEEFAGKLGVPVIAHIPRSDDVQMAEFEGQTVIEALPNSNQATFYRELAAKIIDNTGRYIPNPFESIKDLQELLKRHQSSPVLSRIAK